MSCHTHIAYKNTLSMKYGTRNIQYNNLFLGSNRCSDRKFSTMSRNIFACVGEDPHSNWIMGISQFNMLLYLILISSSIWLFFYNPCVVYLNLGVHLSKSSMTNWHQIFLLLFINTTCDVRQRRLMTSHKCRVMGGSHAIWVLTWCRFADFLYAWHVKYKLLQCSSYM